jgi:hypothetical protein
MTPRTKDDLVLAIHPTSRGFGWVLFEGPLAPVDWGLASVRAKRSARSLVRFERLLTRYAPSTVVFEEFGEDSRRRYERIPDLCRQMIALAGEREIHARVYSRASVRETFERSGARTRHEIARSVAEQLAVFRRRLPRERKRWDSEDVRQSLFDAVALALTHFAVSRS